MSTLVRQVGGVGGGAALALACGGGPAPAPWPPPPPAEAALVRVVGVVPGEEVLGIGVLGGAIAVATPSGQVLRFPEGAPAEGFQLAAGPFEDVAFDGAAGWLSGQSGVWKVPAVGVAVQVAPDPAVAVAGTPAGPCWATVQELRCLRGGAAVTVVPDTHVVFPDELTAVGDALVWADHGTGAVRAWDPATGAVTTLASQRGPHALVAHGPTVVWTESEADLLPGRPAAVTQATRAADGSWTVAPLPFEASGQELVRVDDQVYGAARCSPAAAERWTRFDTGEGWGPVFVTADRFGWPRRDGADTTVVAAPRAACKP